MLQIERTTCRNFILDSSSSMDLCGTGKSISAAGAVNAGTMKTPQRQRGTKRNLPDDVSNTTAETISPPTSGEKTVAASDLTQSVIQVGPTPVAKRVGSLQNRICATIRLFVTNFKETTKGNEKARFWDCDPIPITIKSNVAHNKMTCWITDADGVNAGVEHRNQQLFLTTFSSVLKQSVALTDILGQTLKWPGWCRTARGVAVEAVDGSLRRLDAVSFVPRRRLQLENETKAGLMARKYIMHSFCSSIPPTLVN